MTASDPFHSFFKNITNTSGRASRLEFWWPYSAIMKIDNCRKVSLTCLIIFLGTILFNTSLVWADTKRGQSAYDRGDYKTAFSEWSANAVRGDLWAQRTIGAMLFEGQGVHQNYSEGIRWLEKAARRSDADALNYLGEIYYEGHEGAGISKDITTAFRYLLKATKEGHFDAMRNVIRMYAQGIGVERNYPESYKWSAYLNYISKIAGKGRPDVWKNKQIWSGKILKVLKKKMTVHQMITARELATQCIKDEIC